MLPVVLLLLALARVLQVVVQLVDHLPSDARVGRPGPLVVIFAVALWLLSRLPIPLRVVHPPKTGPQLHVKTPVRRVAYWR